MSLTTSGLADDTRLGVVYDFGSASPLEIVNAAAGVCPMVFVLDSSREHIRTMLPVLRALADCCDISGLPSALISAQLKELGVSHLTTFSERQLAVTGKLARECSLEYRGPGSGPFTDKSLQRAALSAGASSLVWADVDGRADLAAAVLAVGLPMVLKPRSGAGSVNTFKVVSAADVDGVAAQLGEGRWPPMIAEQMLHGDPRVAGPEWGDYVSVESVVEDGVMVRHFVTGKFPLVEPYREQGNVFPSTLAPADEDAVRWCAEQGLTALGFGHGVAHTEIKLTAAGPRIIEVNGRVGGFVWQQVLASTGVDLVRVSMELAVGRSPSVTGPVRDVSFLRVFQPPLTAVELEAVGGVPRPGEIAGVDRVLLVRRPPCAVDWREGSQGMVALAYGHGLDHAHILASVAAVSDALQLRYRAANAPASSSPTEASAGG